MTLGIILYLAWCIASGAVVGRVVTQWVMQGKINVETSVLLFAMLLVFNFSLPYLFLV